MENGNLRERIHKYSSSIALFKNLLRTGEMSQKEFDEIDRKLREKYGVKDTSIFVDNQLDKPKV